MKIFTYESKFSQFMLKICMGCYLNLLWMIASIPIFTMGAATAAMYRVSLKIARDEDPGILTQFIKGFKQNFRQATIAWLIMLGLGGLLAGDGYIIYHLYRSFTGPIAVVVTIATAFIIAAAVVYTIVLIYLFPLIASVENTTFNMFKNSFLIGVRYLFCTILVFAIHFAMFFAVVAIFTPLIIFGIGACALLSSYLLANVITACSYDPNQTEAIETEEETEEEA